MVEHVDTGSSAVGTSESEEMYLITCARAIEEGVPEPIPIARVSEALSVSSVSANQMVKKLESRGLVEYAPYRGVSLTEEGRSIAEAILRRRRLWGVFLWDRLGLDPLRADAVACDMEHITPDDVAGRLATFLGEPEVGPIGRRIPDGAGHIRRHLDPLAGCSPGTEARVASLEGPVEAVPFLLRQGLGVGSTLSVTALGGDGSLLLETSAGIVQLSAEAAEWIRVEV